MSIRSLCIPPQPPPCVVVALQVALQAGATSAVDAEAARMIKVYVIPDHGAMAPTLPSNDNTVFLFEEQRAGRLWVASFFRTHIFPTQ